VGQAVCEHHASPNFISTPFGLRDRLTI